MLYLPSEILSEIFKHIEDDYKALHSCVLVNKQWHILNVPILWRNPFYSVDSGKIIINCLLSEDENFLKENKISLIFDLLEKPPLHNYIEYTTELDFIQCNENLHQILIDPMFVKINCLKERLVKFILDYSKIRKFRTTNLECKWLVNHCRFDTCFQNLYEVICCFSNSSEYIDKLAKACKNIQVLEIEYDGYCSYNSNIDYNLAQLIKAQNKIKQLIISSYNLNLILSADFKKAISIHSDSIFYYNSYGNNNLDSLIPMFKNLKALSLTNYYRNSSGNKIKNINSILFPDIESIEIELYNQPFLLNLLDFIKINGKSLKVLKVNGRPADKEYLVALITSIEQNCQNLENLSIFFKNDASHLVGIFNNCKKLKLIKLKGFNGDCTFDGDDIFTVLGQTLPKNLNTIVFSHKVVFSDGSMEFLMRNWKGPRPFKLEFRNKELTSLERQLLKKYQDIGFLK